VISAERELPPRCDAGFELGYLEFYVDLNLKTSSGIRGVIYIECLARLERTRMQSNSKELGADLGGAVVEPSGRTERRKERISTGAK